MRRPDGLKGLEYQRMTVDREFHLVGCQHACAVEHEDDHLSSDEISLCKGRNVSDDASWGWRRLEASVPRKHGFFGFGMTVARVETGTANARAPHVKRELGRGTISAADRWAAAERTRKRGNGREHKCSNEHYAAFVKKAGLSPPSGCRRLRQTLLAAVFCADVAGVIRRRAVRSFPAISAEAEKTAFPARGGPCG